MFQKPPKITHSIRVKKTSYHVLCIYIFYYDVIAFNRTMLLLQGLHRFLYQLKLYAIQGLC